MNEQFEQLYLDGVHAGNSKDQIIMDFINTGDTSVVHAVKIYMDLAKKHGQVLSYAERVEAGNEFLQEYDIVDPDIRRQAILDFADKFNVSESTATAHVRKFAEANDIELPKSPRHDFEKLIAYVKELVDQGREKEYIVEKLQSDLGYAASSANGTWLRVARELGLEISTRRQTPLADIVSFCLDRENLTKKELIEAIADQYGYKTSTAATFYANLEFAKEYATQLSERQNLPNVKVVA